MAANGDAARVEVRADIEGDARGSGLAHGLRATLAGSVDPQTMGLDARYHGLIDTRATGATGTLRSARLRVDGTVRGASTPDVEGRLDGRVALRALAGDEALQVVGQLRARGTAVGAELEASGDAVSLRASLAATGSVIDSLRLEGRADDLQRLVSNAAGRVELFLVASGPVSALDAEGRLVGESLAWNGVTVGPLSVTGRSEAGRGRIELALPDWRVTGEARVESGRLSGTARLEDTSLAPFSAFAPRPLEGRLAASVRFEVPLQAPAKATVAADVSVLELRSGELAARAPQPFSLLLRRRDAAAERRGTRRRWRARRGERRGPDLRRARPRQHGSGSTSLAPRCRLPGERSAPSSRRPASGARRRGRPCRGARASPAWRSAARPSRRRS